jgi:translation initiation factor eIF-2B subunit alpha/methylthioribose-1-phosphate isomerase
MKLKIKGETIDRPSIWWEKNSVKMIDQTKIPFKVEVYSSSNYRETVYAIKEMIIRGAPSIGAAGAYGLTQAVHEFWPDKNFVNLLDEAYHSLLSARPTAVDLKNGLDYVRSSRNLNPKVALERANYFASRIADEGLKIGRVGKELIKEGMNILTHCNTGALALVDHGSALSPLIQAWESGVRFHVYVDETRPRLQGRITSWELNQNGVVHTVICDSTCGFLMAQGEINLIILGADRVTRNGDIANKIGTYNLAVLAHYHNIPFYTAFPLSTFDPSTPSGKEIQIEERNSVEVLKISGYSEKFNRNDDLTLYLENTKFKNPAFDVTPAHLITGYITPHGIFSASQLLEMLT